MIRVDPGPVVVMGRLRLRDAFAFDRHFEQAGFSLWPYV
jgi:predicted nucleic acid-binding protein